MTNDLETLLTALYVDLEDRVLPAVGWSRARRRGRKPALSDAELICLVVAQQLLGMASERRWIRYAHTHLRSMFPAVIGQFGFGKRLPNQGGLLSAVITELARDVDPWHDRLRPVDSTRSRVAPPGKRSNARTWPGTPATGTAPLTPSSSGAYACI